MTDIWKNRIVGHAEVDPRTLLENPFNFRRHTERQGQWLEASLDELGWIGDVKVNRNTGHMLDGHYRVRLAISKDQPTVPVTYLDLTENEEKRALAIFDRITTMAVEDPDALSKLLDEMKLDTGGSLDSILGDMKVALEVPDVEFKEFDETVADEVSFIECPNCGHKWPA